MSYNTNHLNTAGKITVLTTFIGVVAFVIVFLLNIGGEEVRHVEAQSLATTSVTVVNTAPVWTGEARELLESSTSSPTNAGDAVSWVATGTDANAQDYWLLICSDATPPTANSGQSPNCPATTTQWAISATTTSGTQATAATTTDPSWAEVNVWYGFICDSDSGTPRCNSLATQGTTTFPYQSPFEVNHRPTFTGFWDTSPADPGVLVTFNATSSDSDTSGTADTVQLTVCNEADFSTASSGCGVGGTIATSTFSASDPTASYTIVIPTQDQDYTAYGYIIDNHGFDASGGAQGTDSTLSVNNVAPTVSAASISINGGSNMILSDAAASTTGFTFQYTATDANSCENASSGDEITDQFVSLYRSGVGSTTCDSATAVYGDFNPNNCYLDSLGNDVWDFSCTPNGASCTGATDSDMIFDCTFSLWYITDPTDGSTSTQFSAENWLAEVSAIDDDFATGTGSESSSGVEVLSFLAFALNTITIPYGTLEPGQQTDPITATTTIAATGNVGLDERLQGESMCPTYETGQTCNNSASSTIPASEQVYATSSVSYASGIALSSTTNPELEVNVAKSTATSSQATGDTVWGIRVPGTITLSGDYTGENTFTAVAGEPVDW